MIYEYDLSNNTIIKIHDFEGSTSGGSPVGGLTLASNGKLYGMTIRTGSQNSGLRIYEYDPESNVYTKKIDNDSFRDPEGKLIMSSNGKLYGITFMTLFEYDFENNILTKKFDFDNIIDGVWPKGITAANNGKIYGLTRDGGSNNDGVIFEYDPVSNNYTKLIDFDGTNGERPHNSLTLALNGKLYGMTSRGGIINDGVLFELDPSNNNYAKKYEFDPSDNGCEPYRTCNLTLASNGKLYGITEYGGISYKGVIFEYDPGSDTYTKVFDFGESSLDDYPSNIIFANSNILYCVKNTGGDYNTGVLFEFDLASNSLTKKHDFIGAIQGQSPTGKLIIGNNGKLYGTTRYGGINNNGVIFEYDIATKTYSKRYDFDGSDIVYNSQGVLTKLPNGKLYGVKQMANSSDLLFEFDPMQNTFNEIYKFSTYINGGSPVGGVTLASNGKLYGLTNSGGISGYGVIYEYDLTTDTYIKKYDFDENSLGWYPKDKLTLAPNGKLYGMACYGGQNNEGVLFEYDPITEIYAKKIDFSRAINGANPEGGLELASNGKLYGLIAEGGPSSGGVLFEFDPINYSFTIKKSFLYGIDGYRPWGDVIEASNGKLYGTTIYGGTNYYGVLFEYDMESDTYTKKQDFETWFPSSKLTEIKKINQIEIDICEGDSYEFGTQVLNESGEYLETFQAINGSDSTVLLTLFVNPNYTKTESSNLCSGESFLFPDGTELVSITSPLTHTSNLQTVLGCDSIVETTILLNPVYNLSETVTVNNGGSYTFPDGTEQSNITSQVIYTSNLQTVYGCDSIIETNVNIGCNQIFNSSEAVTVCSGSDYTFPDGIIMENIASQITHTSNLLSIYGCDSIIETTVNVNQGDETYLTDTICQGEKMQFAYLILAYPGIYGVKYSNQFGCDSLVYLDLSVANPKVNLGRDATININDTIILDAGDNFETYYWNTEETSQTIFVDGSNGVGSYIFNVLVSDKSKCVASDTIIITVSDLTDVISLDRKGGNIRLYPNPTSGKITIDLIENKETLEICIFDLTGNLLLCQELNSKETSFETEIPGNSGFYFIRIKSDLIFKTYKVVKN
ncbi:MAG TPA: hypothetical protein DCG75_07745 [Bacteroidales bacterium]|nr:hypothetical protein [Bacteroidales bacterium]